MGPCRGRQGASAASSTNRNLGSGSKDQLASKDLSTRATKQRQCHNLPCSLCLSPFAGLLIFTQGIYLVINGELKMSPFSDKCTSYVFVQLFSCLPPFHVLSFILSGPLGSLNSSVNSALSCSLSCSD